MPKGKKDKEFSTALQGLVGGVERQAWSSCGHSHILPKVMHDAKPEEIKQPLTLHFADKLLTRLLYNDNGVLTVSLKELRVEEPLE